MEEQSNPQNQQVDETSSPQQGAQESPAGQVEPHRGAVVLVLGILGIVVCFILGIVAWVMGNKDLKKMGNGQMDREGEGLTKAGKICGIVSVVLGLISILGAFLYILIFGLAAIGGAAG